MPIFNAISIYLAAHSAVVLKAESMTDKIEWMNKIRSIIQPSKGGQLKGASNEGGLRQSLSDGSLVSYNFRMLLCKFFHVATNGCLYNLLRSFFSQVFGFLPFSSVYRHQCQVCTLLFLLGDLFLAIGISLNANFPLQF